MVIEWLLVVSYPQMKVTPGFREPRGYAGILFLSEVFFKMVE